MSSADYKLRDAAACGDVAEIGRQIAAGKNPNAFEGTADSTPLQWAAINGHLAAIAALLKAGARVDGANYGGRTPLMCAAANNNTAVIDALLAAGAELHRSDKGGDNALHYASRCGQPDAARLLLEAGAGAHVRNNEGKRPIDVVRSPLARCGCEGAPRRHRPVATCRFAGAATRSTSPPCVRCWSGRPP
jgi:ankyrin repeat protein